MITATSRHCMINLLSLSVQNSSSPVAEEDAGKVRAPVTEVQTGLLVSAGVRRDLFREPGTVVVDKLDTVQANGSSNNHE